jgi:hypothetical protein
VKQSNTKTADSRHHINFLVIPAFIDEKVINKNKAGKFITSDASPLMKKGQSPTIPNFICFYISFIFKYQSPNNFDT